MRKREKEQIVKVLVCVKELFSDRTKWTQGAFRAWDRDGKVVAFCAVGGIYECAGVWKAADALDKVTFGSPDYEKRSKAKVRVETKGRIVVQALEALTNNNNLTSINDLHGYNAVMALIDKALAEYQT